MFNDVYQSAGPMHVYLFLYGSILTQHLHIPTFLKQIMHIVRWKNKAWCKSPLLPKILYESTTWWNIHCTNYCYKYFPKFKILVFVLNGNYSRVGWVVKLYCHNMIKRHISLWEHDFLQKLQRFTPTNNIGNVLLSMFESDIKHCLNTTRNHLF